MCKVCVDKGSMSVQELDAAVLAGDTSVIEIADRVAAGTPVCVIAIELLFSLTEPSARKVYAQILQDHSETDLDNVLYGLLVVTGSLPCD